MPHGWHTHDAMRMAAEADAALALAPNDTEVLAVLCEPYALVGLPEKGIASVKRARELDPVLRAAPWPHEFLALAYFVNRQHEEALAEAVQADGAVPLLAAASQAALGRLDEARATVGEALAREPDLTLAAVRQRYPFRDPADLDHLIENLRKAGLPGPG